MPPAHQPKKRHRGRNTLLVLIGVFVTLIVVSVATSSNHPTSPLAGGTSQQPLTQLSQPAQPTEAAQPATPQFTPEQQQVIDSAEGYLTDGQGFSRAGLMKQLTSSYGEGFSRSLALFAIRHLHVNWNHQAVISAKGYVSDGEGFSFNGLVQQLESPYGEQFTHPQAVHGATIALRG